VDFWATYELGISYQLHNTVRETRTWRVILVQSLYWKLRKNSYELIPPHSPRLFTLLSQSVVYGQDGFFSLWYFNGSNFLLSEPSLSTHFVKWVVKTKTCWIWRIRSSRTVRNQEANCAELGDSVCRNATKFSLNGIFKFPYSVCVCVCVDFYETPHILYNPKKTQGLSSHAVGDHDDPSPNSTGYGFYKPPRKRQAVTEVDDIYRCSQSHPTHSTGGQALD